MMDYKKIATGRAGRTLYRRKPGSIHLTEPYGREDGQIELLVDTDYLIKNLGHKALCSKSGVSKLAYGAIVAKVISREKGPR